MSSEEGAFNRTLPKDRSFMGRARDIANLANRRIGLLLDVAEAALPPERFAAFRRIMLREFGSEGFAADVERLLNGDKATERLGTGRNDMCRKGGAT